MDSVNSSRIRYIFFVAIFFLTACGEAIPTDTPIVRSPTPVPPYIHYTPPQGSDIHLEFDYPGSALFSTEQISPTDIMIIGFADPRFITVPTRAPDEPHGTPSDFGRVMIRIWPIESHQTLDDLIKPFKEGYSNSTWITELNSYEIKVDGNDAVVLEYQINENFELYPSTMFERNIFFIAKNQMYQINFLVAERERGGEFEQGYEHFFRSLRILP